MGYHYPLEPSGLGEEVEREQREEFAEQVHKAHEADAAVRHRRGSSVTAIAAAAAILILIGGTFAFLAWLGMLPWRGPLDPREPLGATSGMRAEVGRPIAFTSLWVYNPSRVSATLDSVVPSADLPNVQVVDAWIPADQPGCAEAAALHPLKAPDACRVPVQGFLVPAHTPTGNGPRVVVVLRSDVPGVYRSSGFDFHYHVGLIHYTTTYDDGFVMEVTHP